MTPQQTAAALPGVLTRPGADSETGDQSGSVAVSIDWRAHSLEIDALNRALGLATGRRDALVEREQTTVREVAEAKGRAAYKPEVEEILQILQHEAHERSVGAFERMLTAIARDVKPGTPVEIKLELTTERNMPALDVKASVNGKAEKITSGALCNVVSTGLRFITLARSGRRPLLVLDEADCWIEGGDVQNFFNVVNQLSREAGIQTVIITHHDLSAFEDSFRIYRIHQVESGDGYPRQQPELVSTGSMDISPLQSDVVTSLALSNFEAYTDAHIDLAPGVTAITGPNGSCKSGWARAMRAAFNGESEDSSIRHGCDGFSVAASFSDGNVLEHIRRVKGTPKAEYTLHTPASYAFASANRKTWAKDPEAPQPVHHTPKATIPEWVLEKTGVGPVDGINIQLWPQFLPVFMLDQPPSKRASLLSIGRESGHLFAMNELFSEDVAADNKTIRNGEKEIVTLRSELEVFAGLNDARDAVGAIAAEGSRLRAQSEALDAGSRLVRAIEDQAVEIERLQQWRELDGTIPTEPQLLPTHALEDWAENLTRARYEIARRLDIELPPLPTVLRTDQIAEIASSLEAATAAIELKEQVPAMPSEPKLEPTQALEALALALSEAGSSARIAGSMPELPAPPMIRRTQKLEEWVRHIDAANEGRALPVMRMPPDPTILATDNAARIVDELASNATFLNACRAQAAVLQDRFDMNRRLVDAATAALGFEAFSLPGPIADKLARDAIVAFQSGSNELVVAYFDQIKTQIQCAARNGFQRGTERMLDLPGDYFDTSDRNGTPMPEPDRSRATRP